MVLLGVNIDHVATIRQARRTYEPDPVTAAALADLGGADSITLHLREDRRHIQDRDLRILRQTVFSKLNLEMAVNDEIVKIALDTVPEQVTLVPEKRQEITTEGGLDVAGNFKRIKDVIPRFNDKGILVSLFIDPNDEQIEKASQSGAHSIEIHTGTYANARTIEEKNKTLHIIAEAAQKASQTGLEVFAGHGLTYHNVRPIVETGLIKELNIGHSIISRAVFVGLVEAVRQMKKLLE